MGMCCALHSVSDQNITRLLENPSMVWRLIAPDDPDIYLESVNENKGGFLSKLFGKKVIDSVDVPDLEFIEGENVDTDLDKAWQGIHYCLNRTDYDATPPMNFLTVGGEPIGSIEVGYGPARVISSKMVAEIHETLNKVTSNDIAGNYNPVEMDKLDIYPNIWERDGNEGLEYITEYYAELKAFIAECKKTIWV